MAYITNERTGLEHDPLPFVLGWYQSRSVDTPIITTPHQLSVRPTGQRAESSVG
jgi:hypothetical protein